MRFRKLNFIQASSFPDWGSVSKVMAPLYAPAGLIPVGTPFAAEVAKIRAASADPLARAALALRLVQDQVRYLMLGMDNGHYVPQAPAQTWATRYGDCKAKTLLLLAILADLGITAEPVLASSKLGDLVPNRLPSPGAFDQVLVRASIDGESLWLDGTGGGARLADIRDTPSFGWVLPLRAAGAEPLRLERRLPARPQLTMAIDYDQRAGLTMPAPYRAAVTLRGDAVEKIRGAKAQGSPDDLRVKAAKMTEKFVGDSATVVDHEISFDDAAGTATVVATGVAYPNWQRTDGRFRIGLEVFPKEMNFQPDRARAAWRDIPVATGAPGVVGFTTRYRLPAGQAFELQGPAKFAETLGGDRVVRTSVLDGQTLTVTETGHSSGAEIGFADLPAARAAFAAAKRNMAYVRGAADYSSRPVEVAAARKAGLIEPIDQLYARRIADKPDDQSRLTDRAWFRERVFDRAGTLADMDKAIALEPRVDSYLTRASILYDLGRFDRAMVDIEAALALDPGSEAAVRRLAWAKAYRGDAAAGEALLDEKIAVGDERRDNYIMSKASVQVLGGRPQEAIATIDEAIARKPRDPDLLNNRCWTRSIAGIELDSALKDCTRAIELADDASSALDSRAMAYFKLGKLGEALVDLDAALGIDPEQAGSLFLRGVARRKLGRTAEGDADILAAKTISPQVAREYQRFGVTP